MLKMNVTFMQPQKSPSKTPENNEKQSVIPESTSILCINLNCYSQSQHLSVTAHLKLTKIN